MKDWGDIYKTLESFHRPELEDMRFFFGASSPSGVRKGELVRHLGSFIIENPVHWLSRMFERDLLLLRTLVEAGPGIPVHRRYADYPSVLETVRLIGSDYGDPEYRSLWVPKPLYDVVAPHIDSVIAEGESSGRFMLERAALGYLSYYGVMTLSDFYDVMLDYYEYAEDRTMDEFIDTLKESPILKILRVEVDGQLCITAPQVFEPEEILKARKEHSEIKGLKKVTPEEAIDAGTGAPYFVCGLKCQEGVRFVEMLENFGYSGEDLIAEEHDVWMNSQMVSPYDATEEIFKSVNARQDSIMTTDDFDACMQIVASYANSLPKWVLGGYSSDEANCMKVFLQTEDDPLDAMVRKNPLLGLFVHPAAPFDQCPCGSGLSYCRCHGKYRN